MQRLMGLGGADVEAGLSLSPRRELWPHHSGRTGTGLMRFYKRSRLRAERGRATLVFRDF